MSFASVPRRLAGAVLALCLIAPLSGAAPAGTQAQGLDSAQVLTSSDEEGTTEEDTGPEDEVEDQEQHHSGTDDDAATENTDGEAGENSLPGENAEGAEISNITTDEVSTQAATDWDSLIAVVAEACADGGTVTLEGNITASRGQNLNLQGCEITLDLNGHDLEIDDPGQGNAAVHVPSDAALTITDTSDSEDGELTATGGEYGAGIGGGVWVGGGTVTITGGTINATGGERGAGIGGGGERGGGGTVTIDGGTVTARGGQWAAGIGGGDQSDGGAVTITSGTVTASGGDWAAGIGGGVQGGGREVTITGGTVTATGGEAGAGIGGGESGGEVTITGGTVTATGGEHGAGIGGGERGDGGEVTITGGIITATGGEAAAGIGGGWEGGGGTLVIRANEAEGSAEHGGGQNSAVIDWDGAADDEDLHAYARAEGGADFVLDFGYLLTAYPGFGDDDPEESFRVLGVAPEAPETPDRPRYTFTGWVEGDPDGEAWEPEGAEPMDGPLVLHATWEQRHVADWDSLTAAVAAVCEFGEPGTVTLEANIAAEQDEHLDLADCEITLDLNGQTLEIENPSFDNAAVHVPSGAVLTITDTSDSRDGELIATGGYGGAGIGGGSQGDGGAVTIDGGTVTATARNWGAGIGGGSQGDGGAVTITSGTITATGGDYGAGIGGGLNGSGGAVTIDGGTVTAIGGFGGAGIGGGSQGDGGAVTITSGTITAIGGQDGSGIGGGRGGGGGTLVIRANETEDSAEHGGGPEGQRPTITWPADVEGDLYALVEADENSREFKVEFGHVLELTDFRHGQGQEPVTEQQFLPFSDESATGSIPDQDDTEVPEGFVFTGWRDGAPAGDVIAEEDLADLLDEGSVFLYATAARAELDSEEIVAGEPITVNAFAEDGTVDDVTDNATITFDGKSETPTAAGDYDVVVQYLERTLLEDELTVVAGEAKSLVVTGDESVTEAGTGTYTVVLVE